MVLSECLWQDTIGSDRVPIREITEKSNPAIGISEDNGLEREQKGKDLLREWVG